MDIAAAKPVETCCVFFEHGFVEQVVLAATSRLEAALDNPDRVGLPLPYLFQGSITIANAFSQTVSTRWPFAAASR